MRERLPDYDIVASPEDAPIVLAGPPDELVGRIDLHNPGDVKVVLREAGLRDPAGALPGGPVVHTLHPIVLYPAQARTLPLNIAVDPATPPGQYRCELQLGGRTRPVLMHVAEVFDLSVSPRVTIVENRPGEVQKKQLIVTNEGNVDFKVGDFGEVVLEDDMIWCRAQRAAVGPWTEDDNAGLEDFLVAILRAARHEAYRAGNLDVRNVAGEVTVPAGQTVPIDVEITVPDRLHRNSRYRGVTPLFTVDLEFVVVPSRGADVRKPSPPPAPRSPLKAVKTAKAVKSAPPPTKPAKRPTKRPNR